MPIKGRCQEGCPCYGAGVLRLDFAAIERVTFDHAQRDQQRLIQGDVAAGGVAPGGDRRVVGGVVAQEALGRTSRCSPTRDPQQ